MEKRRTSQMIYIKRTRLLPYLFASILITGLLLSCGRGSATPVPPDNPEALATALEQAGAKAQLGGAQGQAVLGMIPQSLYVGDEQLRVFTSSEQIESSEVLDTFSGEQYVWANEHLIVTYRGRDGGTVLLIDGLLGEGLIRPTAAGDEPYPPAIPAAIGEVAKDLGVQPEAIEVLAYEMVDWDDTCLEMGDPGEVCAEQITTGWRIDLRYEQQEVEVHTDLLGESLRWYAP